MENSSQIRIPLMLGFFFEWLAFLFIKSQLKDAILNEKPAKIERKNP